jgi:hypothetical protein
MKRWFFGKESTRSMIHFAQSYHFARRMGGPGIFPPQRALLRVRSTSTATMCSALTVVVVSSSS